jgi:hypothetical protein
MRVPTLEQHEALRRELHRRTCGARCVRLPWNEALFDAYFTKKQKPAVNT